jgi:chitin synthase
LQLSQPPYFHLCCDFVTDEASSAFFIFATWWWTKYYYVFLPFITLTAALNCIMVFSVIFHTLLHRAIPEKEDTPTTPENMVYLLPCYNETRDECVHSLDSLVEQVNVEQHRTAIMIVCDGRVRGPGMEKTTADYLLDDILTNKSSREYIRAAYTAWDHGEMDVVVQTGTYGGIPYLCIVKEQNQGKRDGLILVRSFLYNFNIRSTQPAVIFSPYFFGAMSSFLCIDATIPNVDVLIGMDADTVFAPDCIFELLKQSHYTHTVGVCGYVSVSSTPSSQWSLWTLYQSTEYTISQCLRRLHQSIATHKVSCLPGCCQLLKICEATCGDHILLNLFGYYPSPTDNLLKQIRATASEDRNHVCLMLSASPTSRTRQALKARAYTDVPRSWSVFLSQRRRWTLGATSNDLYLVSAPGVNWFERILATSNVLTWCLGPFVIASIASFVKACTCKSVSPIRFL